MAADTANGGISQLENHYKTFIVSHPRRSVSRQSLTDDEQTEQDFAEIAGAGLNFVRIPLAYWAIETRDNEPFLAKTSWTYVSFRFSSHPYLTLPTKILPQSDPMGSQVRHPHQPGLPRPSWFPKRVEPFRPSRVRQHAQRPYGSGERPALTGLYPDHCRVHLAAAISERCDDVWDYERATGVGCGPGPAV
jgi:hypothetical protein